MRKLISLAITVAVMAASVPAVFATDVCSNDAHSSADFYVEADRASWLMGQSCTDSNIITTVPEGSVMHVVGMTEGWHKLETESGLTGWMWEDYLRSTTKPFEPVDNTPVQPPVEYEAMRDISGHKYEEAIWYVFNNGIVQGYPDGSYLPLQTIKRGELLKIVVEAKYTDEFEAYEGQGCFTDVPAGEWYAKYVCFAEAEGIVEGYPDGSFQPAKEIYFVEALKIAMAGFGYGYVEGDPWYKPTIDEAADMNIIPIDIYAFNQAFKRGQMAELITRMMKYEEGTLDAYANNDDTSYIVTYKSIEEGLNIEEVQGTYNCVYNGAVLENGEEVDGCMCDNGSVLCT